MNHDTLRPAPLDKRLFAALLDMAIVSMGALLMGMVSIGVLLFVNVQMPTIDLQSPDLSAVSLLANFLGIVVFVLGLFLVIDGYFIFFELTRGATPGKQILGLRVVSLRDKPLTLGQCVIREVFRQIDSAFFFLPLIVIFLNPRRQRLGDMVGNTLVVVAPIAELSSSAP